MSTISASQIVQVNPEVISAGGNSLVMGGLVLTENTRVPVGQVVNFPNGTAVANFFGATSAEAAIAAIYFAGYVGATSYPEEILFSQYNAVNVAAWLRGGSVAAMTLAQLQALSGVMIIVVNGTVYESANIVLSGASSPSAAAATILSEFTLPGFTLVYDSVSNAYVFTSTTTGIASTVGYAYSNDATSTTSTTAAKVLTIGGTVTGTYNVGDIVTGTDGTNSLPAGTTITSFGTGTGGVGTYNISAAATPGNLTSCAVNAYSQQGALVKALELTQATGATLSQGANATTPSAAMNAITLITQNWGTFMTAFDPDGGVGNTQKLLFAAWVNSSNERYAYACWDTDITPTMSSNASSSLGNILTASGSNGTVPIWGTDYTKAAFFCGTAASINFTQNRGRITFAYKGQGGLVPDVTNQTVANNLIANGYNFYGAYATANQQFTGFAPGSITGQFDWADSYVNEIWLNNAFQLALMTLLFNIGSLPYDNVGYGLQNSALNDPIQAGLNFGMFAGGIPLSAAQIAEVNSAAGLAIDTTLSSQGWYLQILPASPTTRAARGTNPINFWYVDAGAIQKITMSSIEVQ